ncbi:MAG: NAD(P)/FAD-dependent oxidoreductase, partial [Myxococcota bacterium]
ARAVLLATGVIDEHPKIPGFQEKWGHSIHHCPYCHGFELRDRPLALLAEGEMIQHMAPLLLNWSQDLVVLSHGQRLDGEVQDELRKREIPLHSAPVTSLEGPGRELARIRLEDGTTIERAGLFVQAKQRQVPLVAGLDLTLDEHGFVAVDAMASTGRPMLWAAGDLTSRFQQVVMAASQGAVAAGAINGALSAR